MITPHLPPKNNIGWLYAIWRGSKTWDQFLQIHAQVKPNTFSEHTFNQLPITTQKMAIFYYLTEANTKDVSSIFIQSAERSFFRQCYQYFHGCLEYPLDIQQALTKEQPFLQFLTLVRYHQKGHELSDYLDLFFNTEPHTLLWLSTFEDLDVRDKAIKHMRHRNKMAEYIHILDDLSQRHTLPTSFSTTRQSLITQFVNGTLHDNGLDYIRTQEEEVNKHIAPDNPLFKGPNHDKFRYGLRLLYAQYPQEAMRIFKEKMLTSHAIERTPLEIWLSFGVDILTDTSIPLMATIRRRLFSQMNYISKHTSMADIYVALLSRLKTIQADEFITAYNLLTSHTVPLAQTILLTYHCQHDYLPASALPAIHLIKPKDLVKCLSDNQRTQWHEYLVFVDNKKPNMEDFLLFYRSLAQDSLPTENDLYLS